MDPWIINDMINRDDMNSSCSSGISESPSNNNFDSVPSKNDLNRVFVPQDKVIQLINALSSNPKAFIKPQRKV